MVKDSRVSRAQEPRLREALGVIHQPACPPGPNRPECATIREHYEGWKKLADAAPAFGYKLLYQPQYRWPNPHYFMRTTRRLPEGFLAGDKEENLKGLDWRRWEKEFGAKGYDRDAWANEIWNKALAYRWMLLHLPVAQRARFLEETIGRADPAEGLIMLAVVGQTLLKEDCTVAKEICDQLPPKLTAEEKEILTTARASFEPADPDGFYRHLADLVSYHLYWDVEMREDLSRPYE